MKKLAYAAILGAGAVLAIGPAKADLIIDPNGNAGGVQAESEPASNGGPGFPLGVFGYTSPAKLVVDVSGDYRFTFESAGDAAAANTFTAYGHTFTANPPGATGAGSTASGGSFDIFLSAGTEIAFVFSSSTGCSLTSGVASTAAGCDYLVALADSPTAPGAFDISQTTAWLGFSDGATTTDADYQDLVVRVDEIPEPASLTLLGAAMVGFAAFWRRQKAS